MYHRCSPRLHHPCSPEMRQAGSPIMYHSCSPKMNRRCSAKMDHPPGACTGQAPGSGSNETHVPTRCNIATGQCCSRITSCSSRLRPWARKLFPCQHRYNCVPRTPRLRNQRLWMARSVSRRATWAMTMNVSTVSGSEFRLLVQPINVNYALSLEMVHFYLVDNTSVPFNTLQHPATPLVCRVLLQHQSVILDP
jgi:hypothetical protein